jgi:hypothetical protein
MGTKSREVIWGGTIMGAKVRARHAREAAHKAAREAALSGAVPISVTERRTIRRQCRLA